MGDGKTFEEQAFRDVAPGSGFGTRRTPNATPAPTPTPILIPMAIPIPTPTPKLMEGPPPGKAPAEPDAGE